MEGGVYITNRFISKIRNTAFTKDDFDPLTCHFAPLTEKQRQTIRESWRAFYEGPDLLRNAAYAFVR